MRSENTWISRSVLSKLFFWISSKKHDRLVKLANPLASYDNIRPPTKDILWVWLLAGAKLSDRTKNNKKITRAWLFEDFVMAMKFVNQVAKLAEKQGHHPDITIWYNKVTLDLSTHSIKGLTENDFIVAAKIDGLIS